MSDNQALSSEECLQARVLLGWTLRDLREQSQVSIDAILQLERGEVGAQPGTLRDLRAAFEAAGITFTQTGVRLTVNNGTK
jgi:transcriptional regulator with XRE-family HTH domain